MSHVLRVIHSSEIVLSFVLILTVLMGIMMLSPHAAMAINFDAVVSKALKESVDIEIARTDIELSDMRVKEAAAMYLPTVYMRLGNEYLHDLDKGNGEASFIGDTSFSGSDSTFQHSLSVNLNYNLYDFGARGFKYDNVKRDAGSARSNLIKLVTDLKITVLSIYVQCLNSARKSAAGSEITEQRKAIYNLTRKLREAGSRGEINVVEAAVNLAEAVNIQDDYNRSLQKYLNELSFYTREKYDSGTEVLEDLDYKEVGDKEPDYDTLPDIVVLESEIKKKEAEYKISVRERFPKLTLYSSYKLYGSDDDSFRDSFADLSRKNSTIGINLDLNLFEGFGNTNKAKRLKLEIDKLKLQKQRRVEEIKSEITNFKTSARSYGRSSQIRDDGLAKTKDYYRMNERLAEQKVLDQIVFREQQINILEKKLAFELKNIEWAANNMQLMIMTEGAGR